MIIKIKKYFTLLLLFWNTFSDDVVEVFNFDIELQASGSDGITCFPNDVIRLLPSYFNPGLWFYNNENMAI